jgi:hypothetical protein
VIEDSTVGASTTSDAASCERRSIFVHLILRGQGRFGSLLDFPGSGDVLEIATLSRSARQSDSLCHGINGCLVQTYTRNSSTLAEGGVKVGCNAANGVLHASTINMAGRQCKQPG